MNISSNHLTHPAPDRKPGSASAIRRHNAGKSELNPSYYVPGEYDGLSGSFANACRAADHEFRKQQAKRQPSQARSRVPKSTLARSIFC